MIELLMTASRYVEPRVTASLLFQTDNDMNWFKSLYQPQGAQEILASWPRIENISFYANGAAAPAGSVSNWYYDADRDSFVQPDNSGSIQSIVSPVKLTQYIFESTLTSTNADDDLIGLVAAADVIDGGVNIVYVAVNAGGLGPRRFCIRFADSTNPEAGVEIMGNNILPSHANSGSGNGWSGKRVKVRVSRNGNMISAKCSTWNGSSYLDASELILNLNDLPRNGPQLSNPSRYGFCTQSQAGSTYLGYSIQSAEIPDDTLVYSAETNTKWKYSANSWNFVNNSAPNDFSNFDRVINTKTGDIFNSDGTDLTYNRSDGIVEVAPPTTINVAANSTDVRLLTDLVANFTYHQPLTIIGIMEETGGVTGLLSADDLTITTQAINGSLVLYITSPDDSDLNTGINSQVIRFVRLYINVI